VDVVVDVDVDERSIQTKTIPPQMHHFLDDYSGSSGRTPFRVECPVMENKKVRLTAYSDTAG